MLKLIKEYIFKNINESNLNTSHVKVNQFVEPIIDKDSGFKYISC